jgi:hypothetical protein
VDVGRFLGHSDPALEVALFRHGKVAGEAVHGVIEAVSRKFVVWSKPLEDGGALSETGQITGVLKMRSGSSAVRPAIKAVRSV